MRYHSAMDSGFMFTLLSAPRVLVWRRYHVGARWLRILCTGKTPAATKKGNLHARDRKRRIQLGNCCKSGRYTDLWEPWRQQPTRKLSERCTPSIGVDGPRTAAFRMGRLIYATLPG